MKVDYLDTVRNTVSGVVGIVAAIYTDPINNLEYIDVKIGEEMEWSSPVSNWEVVSKNDELEGLT